MTAAERIPEPKPTPPPEPLPLYMEYIIGIAGILMAIAFYGGAGWAIYYYWRDIVGFVQSIVDARVALLLLALIVAPAAYLIRSVARLHYGLAEIMFGVVSIASSIFAHNAAAAAASAAPPQTFDIQTATIQAAAGVYIIVRGLDNVKEGLKTEDHPIRRAWDLLYSEARMKNLRVRFGLAKEDTIAADLSPWELAVEN